jgi:hypothetical protein
MTILFIPYSFAVCKGEEMTGVSIVSTSVDSNRSAIAQL